MAQGSRTVRPVRLCAVAALGLVLSMTLHAAPGTAVADAAAAGDHEAVRTLLKGGGDVNAAQGDGMTALHWAASRSDAPLASMLLQAGANTRATTRLGGYTPLHLASQAASAETITTLLRAGADVGARTSTGATALMLASRAGVPGAVAALLAAGADVNAKEAAYGQDALMFAAAHDRADVVRMLLDKGADASVASTFVDLVALAEVDPERPGAPPSDETAKQVAGAGRNYRYNELIGGQGGLTALHFAARQGALASVRAFVEHRAPVNSPSPADGSTPLLVAIVNGHFDVAMYLLEHGAEPGAANGAGVTPLYAALNVQWAPKAAYPQPRAHLQQRTTYLELLRTLLAKGADPNARLRKKVWFASYNFDQSGVDEVGATPFWRAAYAADVEAMKLLLSHGADPHIPTTRPAGRPRNPEGGEAAQPTGAQVPVGGPGVTPLQAAAGVGYGKGFAGNSHTYSPAGLLPAVKFLADVVGADVNAADHEGNTALHHAAARGDDEMIRYLVSKGANVKAVNRFGQNVADMANGPVQRVQPFPQTLALLASLGVSHQNRCVSC